MRVGVRSARGAVSAIMGRSLRGPAERGSQKTIHGKKKPINGWRPPVGQQISSLSVWEKGLGILRQQDEGSPPAIRASDLPPPATVARLVDGASPPSATPAVRGLKHKDAMQGGFK